MSVCVVVPDDDGASAASHALRDAGWGGVHFEAASADAAVRMTRKGRATVLNTTRLAETDVAAALAELGAAGFDWRVSRDPDALPRP